MSSDSSQSDARTLGGDGPAPFRVQEPRVGDRLAGRFTLVEMLGAGAHGVVYDAEDESGGRHVALKVLTRLEPDELYRFKREFRVLADVTDEHLVTLHELFIGESGAFFTMELIAGTDLLSYTRDENYRRFDPDRLRRAVHQLARGLTTLHGFGRLHRDLKPSNVLVSHEGHVSIADFGLAEELARQRNDPGLVGTPAYMSPEQAAGLELTPASDWYAVGVMLYETLTGALPFPEAFGMQLLIAKQGPEPPPPSSVDPRVPEDLDVLCAGLLRRDPRQRFTDAQVFESLGRHVAAGASDSGTMWPQLGTAVAATGRERELATLRRAFAHTRTGPADRAAMVLLHGRSGMGKTTVLEALVTALDDTAVVLRGRCYERESLPYKGLDALVDELRDHLRREPPLAAVAGASSLAQLFPVLGNVEGIGSSAVDPPEDPVERRRQAVAALREVLRQLVLRKPLVLILDDLQWCDADTVAILLALLRPHSRPGMLVVGCYRDEDLDPRSPLAILQDEMVRAADPTLRYERLAIEPLPAPAARELALRLLGDRDDAAAMADAIGAEAEGSPLFITELVRSVSAGRRLAEGESVALDDVIRERAQELPPDARTLLETSVLAAGPLEQATVSEAAGVEGAPMIAILRSRSFIRTHGPLLADTMEPFHDRIRTAIVEGLDARQIRRGHARLADVLERERADPETVATHLLGAGEPQRAGEYVARAAEAAVDALAFERAARLYALALELVPGFSGSQPGWRQARAEALAHAGRSAESAAAYIEAFRHADSRTMIPLQRNAAEQWLRSGRVDEGTRELGGVLGALGLRYPADPRLAMAGFLWLRARIRLRGTEFEERPESDIDARLLLRIDTTWTAATGLQQSNVIVGQYFQAQHLLLALEAGEPHRVARALGVEAIYAAIDGSEGATQVDALVERVLGLARRLDDPRARGIAHLASGAADLYRGRFVSARPHLERAQDLLRSHCTNVAWELSMTRTFLIMVLYHLGDFPKLQRAMSEALDDAAERDDIHTGLMIRVAFGPMPALAAGDLNQAHDILAECETQWPSQLQTSTYSYVRMLTRARLERYARRPKAAWQTFEAHWPTIVRSMMLTKQPFRTFLMHDRACTAAWLAWDSRGLRRRTMLRQASKDAEVLMRQGTQWSIAMGLSIIAMLSHARGRRSQALDEALQAERRLEELSMRVFASCMQRRRGEILGGPTGAALIREANATLADAGIDAPGPIADMLLPPSLGW